MNVDNCFIPYFQVTICCLCTHICVHALSQSLCWKGLKNAFSFRQNIVRNLCNEKLLRVKLFDSQPKDLGFFILLYLRHGTETSPFFLFFPSSFSSFSFSFSFPNYLFCLLHTGEKQNLERALLTCSWRFVKYFVGRKCAFWTIKNIPNTKNFLLCKAIETNQSVFKILFKSRKICFSVKVRKNIYCVENFAQQSANFCTYLSIFFEVHLP